jgi:predicted AAA+ superfamily ATPase
LIILQYGSIISNMQGYLSRLRQSTILSDLDTYPAVAVLGPRQCGKSTLCKEIIRGIPRSVYLDMELPSDVRKLDDPELFLGGMVDRLVCIDEIQRRPELFPVLRALIDQERKPGRFLLLGSASRNVLSQSSETLAGRISFISLSPFLQRELEQQISINVKTYWLRGGFPNSLFTPSDNQSLRWRRNLISTYLERDLPSLGYNIDSRVLGRLWTMIAADQGQVLNASRLGEALGVSHHTVKSWMDALESAFVLRQLPPYLPNTRKRLVKSPKVYVRDSGILHALLDVENFDDLMGRSIVGNSWEGLVVENILEELPDWKASYYRTQDGAELDLILEKGARRVAVEAKASVAPNLTRGFYTALQDLEIQESYIAAPVSESWPMRGGTIVASPAQIARHIQAKPSSPTP